MSAGTEHRKLTAIIPLCGTDMVSYSALRRWVLLLSNDPPPGKVCP